MRLSFSFVLKGIRLRADSLQSAEIINYAASARSARGARGLRRIRVLARSHAAQGDGSWHLATPCVHGDDAKIPEGPLP